MTAKDLLLDHLECTFEKETWQQPLSMAIDGLNARQAAWKPGPERHSVWQIVRHVIHWKRAVLEAWDGATPSLQDLSKADWGEVSGSDATWQADVQTLHALSQQVKSRIGGADDRALSHPMPTYQGVPDQATAIRILRMATHDIYHAGQIRYIRALQGV